LGWLIRSGDSVAARTRRLGARSIAAILILGAGCSSSSPATTPPHDSGSGGGDSRSDTGSDTGGGTSGDAPTMLSRILTPSADTFINSGVPDNNNGASSSLFTGVEGMGGVMRGLIQFTMPSELQGRANVKQVQLTATLRALGNGTAGPGSVESLQVISEAWVQGNGVADARMTFVIGQPCAGTVVGATWNQPSCAPGTTASWTTPGATVATTVSGQTDTTGVALEGHVTWDSAAAGNAGMIADVQAWIDDPSRNHGWRVTSSNEATPGAAQRFYASEAGAATAPTLTISYTAR
jgi:hypothetical protein